MWNRIRISPLSLKIALLGSGSVLITALALVLFAVWQGGRYNTLAQDEVDGLLDDSLDHITRGVYNLVQTDAEAVQSQVDSSLKVARYMLDAGGPIHMADETVEWTAVNQFSGVSANIRLPKMLAGNQWFGQNCSFQTKMPVVDDIARLVGETATIFQRMNDRGDMLRVATTVRDSRGERALGTYIPAVNPDGTPNSVVGSILKGKSYHGRAFVVDAWYLTAYEPLYDTQGALIGMLYVGVKQQVVESRIRQAIIQTKIGRSGYVFIVEATPGSRGRYVISRDGLRDGETIWNSQNESGRYLQIIVEPARHLAPGEMTTVHYSWQNPGDPAPRWKVARLAYYAPWDWVIGTSVYDDEMQAYRTPLREGRLRMTGVMAVAGVLISILVGVVGFYVAWRITRAIRFLKDTAEHISRGELNRQADASSRDEIGALASTFNFMVHQLKETMDGLAKSEQFLSEIVENIPNMIFVKDARTLRFVRFNRAGEKLLGFSRNDMIGKNDGDLFPKNEADYFAEKDRQVLASGQMAEISEETIHTRQRGIRILHTRKIPLYDQDGTPRHLLGISEDITERKANEDARIKSEQKYRTIFEYTGSASIIMDKDSVIQLCNTEWVYLSGYSRDETEGRMSWTKFVVPEDLDRMKEYHRARRDDPVSAPRKYEFRFIRRNGEIRQMINCVGVVPGTNLSVASMVDITERKHAEGELIKHRDHLEELVRERTAELLVAKERAETANQSKSVFLTKMSHELRTPLNAILGYAQIFMRKPLDREVLKGIAIMQQSGEHLLTLINDILSLSKIEAKKMELYPTPVEFAPFLEGIIGIIRSRAEAKGLILRFEAPVLLPGIVTVDETRLRQVLLNLLANAVKFTTSGQVDFRVIRMLRKEEESDQIVLQFEVEDTGIGIPADQLPRLFKPFEQVSSGPRWAEGTGLGLAISRQLVQLMGGDITVTSEPGKGSLFRFQILLPFEESTPQKTIDSGRSLNDTITGYEGPRRKVLIVDDVDSNRGVLVEMLRPLGFEIVEAVNGHQAVVLAERERPDLILLDHYMPEMNGFEAALRMRRMPALRHAVVIAVSASVSEVEQANSRNMGFDDFLPKPVNWPKLAEVIERHMQLRWRYASPEDDADGTPAKDAAEDGITPPPYEDLILFRDLARMGDMTALIERAKQLRLRGNGSRSFAEHLIDLASGFQERELSLFIEQWLRRGDGEPRRSSSERESAP